MKWLGMKEVKLFLDLDLVCIIYGNYCSVDINPLMPYHTLSPQLSLTFWSPQTIPLQKGLKDRVQDHTVSPEPKASEGKSKESHCKRTSVGQPSPDTQ